MLSQPSTLSNRLLAPLMASLAFLLVACDAQRIQSNAPEDSQGLVTVQLAGHTYRSAPLVANGRVYAAPDGDFAAFDRSAVGSVSLPAVWSAAQIAALTRGTKLLDNASSLEVRTSVPAGSKGFRLHISGNGVERAALDFDFTRHGGQLTLKALRASLRNERGQRVGETSLQVPSLSTVHHVSREQASLIAAELFRAAALTQGDCAAEQRDVLLAAGSLVVATAIGNPLAVMWATLKVAESVYDLAACMEPQQ